MHAHLAAASFSSLALAAAAAAQNQGLTITNGVDTYVDVPYAPTLVPATGVTLEAWVTYDDSTIGSGWRWPTVARQNSTPGQERYFLRVQAGQTNNLELRFKIQTTAGAFGVSWFFAPGRLQTWTHVAGSFDGQTLRLVVDGQEVANTPASGVINDLGGELRIGDGDLSAAGIEAWNGEIDEVRLWPFGRTAAEIDSLRGYELNSVPGEVSTWNLNGNAMDSSGSNHGMPVNAPTFAANSLTLAPQPGLLAIGYGNSSNGCVGPPTPAITGLAKGGNPGFGIVAIRVKTTGAGALWLAAAPLNTPLRVLGLDVWVDITAPGVLVPAVVGPLATARVALPIPMIRRGGGLYAQMFFADGSCTPSLYSSSALTVPVIP